MVAYKIKNQFGFLLIVALMLISFVSFVSVFLVHMFREEVQSAIKSAINSLRSYQAFYVTISGLEVTKHQLIKDKATCDYDNKLFNFDVGVASIKSTERNIFPVAPAGINTVLKHKLDVYDTIVTLNDENWLGSEKEGVFSVDSELIYYRNKVGAVLSDVTRGVLNTSASKHDGYLEPTIWPTPVTLQNCNISVSGSVNDGDITYSRNVRQILQGSFGFRYKSIVPTIVSDSKLGIVLDSVGSSGLIWNNNVMAIFDKCINGSNIVTAAQKSEIGINNLGFTGIGTDITTASVTISTKTYCSNKDTIKPDIVYNYNFTDNIESYFFTGICDANSTNYSVDMASCIPSCTVDKLPKKYGYENRVIYVPSALRTTKVNENAVIGVYNDCVVPEILYITESLILDNGARLVVYGIIYVAKDVIVKSGSILTVNGQLIVKGKTMVGEGSQIINNYQSIVRMEPFYCKCGNKDFRTCDKFTASSWIPSNLSIHESFVGE